MQLVFLCRKILNFSKKRTAWIDLARVISLFVICVAHSSAFQLPGVCLVMSSVTLFFYLSGFFNSSSFWKVVIRAAKLLFVAFLWFLISAIVDCYMGKVEDGFACYLVNKMLFYPAALWFIEYLVIALPVSYLVNKLPITFSTVICILLTFSWCKWDYLQIIGLQEITKGHPHPDWLPFSVMIVSLGGICKRFAHGTDDILPHMILNTLPYVGIVLCALIIVVARVFGGIFTGYIDVYSIFGAYVLLSFSYYISKTMPVLSARVAALAPSLIFVYLSHGLFNRIFITLYLRIFCSEPPDWVMCAFCASLIVGAAYLLFWSKRYRTLLFLLFAR